MILFYFGSGYIDGLLSVFFILAVILVSEIIRILVRQFKTALQKKRRHSLSIIEREDSIEDISKKFPDVKFIVCPYCKTRHHPYLSCVPDEEFCLSCRRPGHSDCWRD